MQLATFGDLNLGAEQFFDGMGKWLANIPSISQDALNRIQVGGAAAEGKQSTFTVGYIGRRNGDCMGQGLGILRNVALDSRNFFASIVALLASTIGVLDALCVDDQKLRRGFAPLSCTSLADHIFLKPAPGR